MIFYTLHFKVLQRFKFFADERVNDCQEGSLPKQMPKQNEDLAPRV